MGDRVAWPVMRRSLVAILRGIKPGEVLPIVETLVEAGFEAIEVPLNSPDAFRSIESAQARFGTDCLIGAGTVLTTQDVDRLADIGARLIVSPNVDPEIISRSKALGLVSMPGVFTPSEAFLALKSGASALKFFPAGSLGPEGIKAMGAVLPADTVIGVVGGVSDANFGAYAAIGVRTFGLGSSLYRPGDTAANVRDRAQSAIAAYDEIFPKDAP